MNPEQDPDFEHTAGIPAARQALDHSRRASVQTDTVVAEARAKVAELRERRDRNHFRDKLHDIIIGKTA